MKLKIRDMKGAEGILSASQFRGNIPTNYMISRNLELVQRALRPFQEAFELEPLRQLKAVANLPAVEDADNPRSTVKQLEEANAELARWLDLEVEFEPYRISLEKVSPELLPLGEVREHLDEDNLVALREDFRVLVSLFGLVYDEREEQ